MTDLLWQLSYGLLALLSVCFRRWLLALLTQTFPGFLVADKQNGRSVE